MKSNFDNLDQLAERLGELSPSRPNAQLAHRLEMALHQADKEVAQPSNIIYHPFVQWTLAAAALFVALIVAFQSTRFEAPAGAEVAQAESEVSPIYKFVNGELLKVEDSEATLMEVNAQRDLMQRESKWQYQGIQIIEGQSFRRFQHESGIVVVQPIYSKNLNLKNSTENASPNE